MEDEKKGVNRIFWYTTEVPTYVKNKDEKKKHRKNGMSHFAVVFFGGTK